MLPVVKRIARTIARRANDPIEDLFQAGSIGLLKAIEHYNKERNDNFRVYAGYIIIGEMKHFLRDKLSMIRVPSYIQELNVRINKFEKELTLDELQTLTSSKMAAALHVKPATVERAIAANRRKDTLSLDNILTLNDSNLSYEEVFAYIEAEPNKNYEDVRLIFQEVFPLLSLDEKILMDMYYNQERTQKEIADAFGVTQMIISRRLKKLFTRIAEIFEEIGVNKVRLEQDLGDE